jgi:hypothetical protein
MPFLCSRHRGAQLLSIAIFFSLSFTRLIPILIAMTFSSGKRKHTANNKFLHCKLDIERKCSAAVELKKAKARQER